jgi:hypothetical protein
MGFDQIVLVRQKLGESAMKFGNELFNGTLSIALFDKSNSGSIRLTLIHNKNLMTSKLRSSK